MPESAARTISSRHVCKAAGALLLLAGLTFLVGCQSVSAACSSAGQLIVTPPWLLAARSSGPAARIRKPDSQRHEFMVTAASSNNSVFSVGGLLALDPQLVCDS